MSATNSQYQLDAAHAYRRAAISDGWTFGPLYGHETYDRACKLKRDGFVMHIISRDNSSKTGKFKYDASISIWGPDGLCVRPPAAYSFAEIKKSSERCNHCGGPNGNHRYSFAGRCCAECLPEMQRTHEQTGWCD